MCREALTLADHLIPRQGVIWKGQWSPPVATDSSVSLGGRGMAATRAMV